MDNNVFIAIMAGGGGTRLWPLSRRAQPKHVLPLFSGRSLFELTLERLTGLIPIQRFMIITTEQQINILISLGKMLTQTNFIIEPEPKGTASVAAIASYAAYSKNPEAIVALLPSDHLIAHSEKFRELFTSSCEVAAKGYFVTLGIQPDCPNTGYGYIRKGASLGFFGKHEAFELEKFQEKPTLRAAQLMLKKGKYFWNSGMFFWKAKCFIEQFAQLMPQQSKIIDSIYRSWKQNQHFDLDAQKWKQLIAETVDYGVMEKCTHSAVLPAEGLGWNDLGSWESFFDVNQLDSMGNIILNGEILARESEQVLVYAENSDKLISLIGVNNMVIIDTKDALLVCRKQDAQKIKEIVTILKEKRKTNLL